MPTRQPGAASSPAQTPHAMPIEAISSGAAHAPTRMARAGLAAMPALRALRVGYNQLSGPLPAAWSAPALQQLAAGANMLAGALPAALAALPALAVLDLQARPACVNSETRASWPCGPRPSGPLACWRTSLLGTVAYPNPNPISCSGLQPALSLCRRSHTRRTSPHAPGARRPGQEIGPATADHI